MVNQSVIVGRIADEIIINENNQKDINLSITVPRNYKNENAEYEVDNINILFTNGIIQNIKNYCKKGDLIAVKGRLEKRQVNPNEKVDYITELVAEKVTILSNNKGGNDESTTSPLSL